MVVVMTMTITMTMMMMMMCGHVYYVYVEAKGQLYEVSPLLSLSILIWSCTEVTRLSKQSLTLLLHLNSAHGMVAPTVNESSHLS